MNTCKLLVCGAESPVVSTGVRIFQEALSEKNLRFEQIRFVPASISGESLIIVIGTAAIIPHRAMADSLMEQISVFVEENCEAEILGETREIR